MNLDTSEHEWLHTELTAMLEGEPPMASSLGDDVRRGRAARSARARRRVVALTVVAVVVAVAIPSALLLRPSGTSTPPGSVSSPSTAPLSGPDSVRPRVEPVLADLGWSITGEIRPTIHDGSGRTELDFSLVRTDDPDVRSALYVNVYPSSDGPGYYQAKCTREICPTPLGLVRSCPGPPGCPYTDSGTIPAMSANGLDWGSLIIARAYPTGTLVELVVAAFGHRADRDPVAPVSDLTIEETQRLLDAIGDPFANASGPSTPSPAPSVSGAVPRPCRDSDVKLTPAVDPDPPLGARSVVLEVHARNPQVLCSVSGYADVEVRAAGGDLLPLTTTQVVGATPTIVVTQTSTPAARFTVTQGRCDSEPQVAAPALLVTLPGETVATTVELPSGLAPVACPGGSADSRTLRVTAFASP